MGKKHDEVNGYDVAGQEIITPAQPQPEPQKEEPKKDDDKDGK